MSEDVFAFTEEYQTKVLSLMLNDPQFCSIAKEALSIEQFANKALQWFFTSLSQGDNFHTSITLKEDLFKSVRTKSIKEDDIGKYTKLFAHISKPPLPVENEHIKATLGNFIRTQEVKRVVMSSFDLIEQGRWDEMSDKMVQACQAGINLDNRGISYFEDLHDRCQRRINESPTQRIPTGIAELDAYLNGGVKNKQLALTVGGTGRGKSLFLQYIARTAILMGRKVVYFTLELPEEDIAMRFDSMFSRIRMNEVNLYNNEVFKKISPLSHKYGHSLVIKEYPADEVTVNGLKIFLSQLSATGFEADVVIVDYLDLLKPHRIYKDQIQETDAITKALHGMAKGRNTRVWTASQLNRSGIAMENPDETSIAGAIAKLFTVDLAIFMAQTSEEREDEFVRLLVNKNRNGKAGRAVTVSTDFEYMTFCREEEAQDAEN